MKKDSKPYWKDLVDLAKQCGMSPSTVFKVYQKNRDENGLIDADKFDAEFKKAQKIALARSKNKSVRRMNLLVPNNWSLLQLLDLPKYDIRNYGLADFGRLGCDEYSHVISNEDKNTNRYGEFLKISQSEGKTTLTDFTWADFYLYAALYSLEKQ